MRGKLEVFLLNEQVGHLYQDDQGLMTFEYTAEWLQTPHAIPLSLSLPLQPGRFPEKKCKPFFAGVLPDTAKRRLIARNLGVSANNDFSLLEQIGGECAGAVTFVSKDLNRAGDEDYRALPVSELEQLLIILPQRPLMAGDRGVRLSLAGAQDKIAVYKKGEEFFLPLNNSPSSHIIKPDIAGFKGIVFNEAFCMTLAAQVGLPVAKVELIRTNSIDALAIERYDRVKAQVHHEPTLKRIHQEDFCQALGVVSERKYQAEGGPSLKACFDLLRNVSSLPVVDLGILLDAVIFNFLIGNNDAHAKNFSLLHQMPQHGNETHTRLAPLYDLICTRIYPNLSSRMAMKIGRTYECDEVDTRQFEKLADEIDFAKPLVKRRVADIANKIIGQLDKVHIAGAAANDVREFIHSNCSSVLSRF